MLLKGHWFSSRSLIFSIVNQQVRLTGTLVTDRGVTCAAHGGDILFSRHHRGSRVSQFFLEQLWLLARAAPVLTASSVAPTARCDPLAQQLRLLFGATAPTPSSSSLLLPHSFLLLNFLWWQRIWGRSPPGAGQIGFYRVGS
jgi:hypothetical protein